MAVRTKSGRALASVLAGAAIAAAGPAATASAASGAVTAGTGTSTPLPLAGYSAIVADSSRHHVFVSAVGSDAIAVTDFAGKPVTTITGEPGAAALALSRNGHTLYVALTGADAVSAIDTTTLRETARYTTGTDAAPVHLAVIDDEVWFSYGAQGSAGIGKLDPRHATVTLTPERAFYAAPLLAASSSAPGVLVAGETYAEPSVVEAFDVNSGAPVLTAATDPFVSDGCTFVDGLAITPDGSDVIVTCGSPYHATSYTLSGLVQNGTYQTGPYPASLAVARTGEIAVGTDVGAESVYLFNPGGSTAIAAYQLGGNQVNGLTWDREGRTLFAVTTDVYGANPVLNVIDAG